MGLLSRKKASSPAPPPISGPLPSSNVPSVPTTDYNRKQQQQQQQQQQQYLGTSSAYQHHASDKYGSHREGSGLPSPPGSPVEAHDPNYPSSSYKEPPTPPYSAQSNLNRPLQSQQAQAARSHNSYGSQKSGRSDMKDDRYQQQSSYGADRSNHGSYEQRSSGGTLVNDREREVEGKMENLGIHSSNGRPKAADRISVESVEMVDGTREQGGYQGGREEQSSRQGQHHTSSSARQQPQQQQSSHHHQQQQPQGYGQQATSANRNVVNRPLSATAASNVLSPTPSNTSSTSRKTSSRYNLSDFTFIRTLGTGSFGRVHLVRSQHNSRSYAVKVLSKDRVVKMKQVEHTNSEREMLERVRHPFLVNLWGTFKDTKNLYMVMDFVAGGELFSLLRKSQRFPDPVAKFFAAEVALALDYLHSLDIIYRDLKPENILLGADGHVKITDFGFAKHVPDITWTLCGTPDYLAPEIVQSRGYNKSVDWYALGVLMFEMLAGYPPFFTEDSNPMRLYEKIIAGKVRYPAYFAPEAKDLLKSLLTPDITKRFGNLANGSRDIFGHVWFQEVDWERLYRKEIPAPYVPKVEGDWDASNFDAYPEVDLSEYGNMTGADPHGHLFPLF